MTFGPRPYDIVLREARRKAPRAIGGRQSSPLEQLGDYWEFLAAAGPVAFTDDFVLLRPSDAARLVKDVRYPDAGLGERWWPFARTRGGDVWLAAVGTRARGEVAFLDHDDESRATPKGLGIEFTQWVQLADLMRQVEVATDAEPGCVTAGFRLTKRFRAKVVGALNAIAPKLDVRFPFQL